MFAKRQDSAGVYFVTALSGLLAPYWRDDVRGTIGIISKEECFIKSLTTSWTYFVHGQETHCQGDH